MSTPRHPNRKLAEGMEALGFSQSVEGNYVKIKGNLTAVQNFVQAVDQRNLDGLTQCDMALDNLRGRDSDTWKGGSFAYLTDVLDGKLDMRPLLEQQAIFQKSGLLARLQTTLAEILPRRKRVMSEEDGEWDMDRRWEIQPFQATTKAMGMGRTMDIVCHCSVNSSTGAEELNKYGAITWAISDMVEKAGIRTRVVLSYRGTSIGTQKNTGQEILIDVKKPGEYIASPVIGATMQTVFFRRPIFALIVACANMNADSANSSLGRAVQEYTRIAFKNGCLELSPTVNGASAAEIEKAILEAIRSPNRS